MGLGLGLGLGLRLGLGLGLSPCSLACMASARMRRPAELEKTCMARVSRAKTTASTVRKR